MPRQRISGQRVREVGGNRFRDADCCCEDDDEVDVSCNQCNVGDNPVSTLPSQITFTVSGADASCPAFNAIYAVDWFPGIGANTCRYTGCFACECVEAAPFELDTFESVQIDINISRGLAPPNKTRVSITANFSEGTECSSAGSNNGYSYQADFDTSSYSCFDIVDNGLITNANATANTNDWLGDGAAQVKFSLSW